MRFIFPALVVVLSGSVGFAQETHTIRLKLNVDPGKAMTSADAHKDKGTTKILDADGKVVKEISPGGAESVTRDIVLEADKLGNPTKYIRKYEKANNTEDGKTTAYSYEGRTLLFEKKVDGTFRIGVEGKDPIDARDTEKLFRAANKPSESDEIMKQLDPKKPVKVGESWKLDPKPIAKALAFSVDEAKSILTARLSKVTMKGNAKVGTFEIDLKLMLTESNEPILLKFDPPATFSMKGTVEMLIDASSTEVKASLKAELKGEGKYGVGGKQGKIVFDVSGSIEATESAETEAKALAKVPAVTWLGPGEWAKFKPKDGSFSVEFPGVPKEDASKSPRGDTTVQWTVARDQNTLSFVVATTDFGAADPSKIDAKAVLDAVRKNQKEPKGMKDYTQNGHPGIVFTREDKNTEFHHRVVMANGRMFQQIVIAEKGKAKPADVEKFFKSFDILLKAKLKDD